MTIVIPLQEYSKAVPASATFKSVRKRFLLPLRFIGLEGGLFFLPGDEGLNSCFEAGLGLVAEEFGGLADVGPGLPNVAGLLGLAVDNGFFAEDLLDGGDHLAEGNGVVIAEVDDGVGR